MDMKEICRVAREKFKGACRVCPVCNGRACAGEMPGIGGIGTGSSFIANFESLARIKLNMRTIHEVREPEIGYNFFGRSLKMPILVAPLAGMVINMGNAMEERPYLLAMVAGAKEAGSMAGTCDGPNPLFFDLGMEILKENGGWGVPTLKPRPEENFLALAKRAEDCGVNAIATDIDAAGIVHMKKVGQPAGPWPVQAWKKTLSRVKVPVILKGVMTVQDARTRRGGRSGGHYRLQPWGKGSRSHPGDGGGAAGYRFGGERKDQNLRRRGGPQRGGCAEDDGSGSRGGFRGPAHGDRRRGGRKGRSDAPSQPVCGPVKNGDDLWRVQISGRY